MPVSSVVRLVASNDKKYPTRSFFYSFVELLERGNEHMMEVFLYIIVYFIQTFFWRLLWSLMRNEENMCLLIKDDRSRRSIMLYAFSAVAPVVVSKISFCQKREETKMSCTYATNFLDAMYCFFFVPLPLNVFRALDR